MGDLNFSRAYITITKKSNACRVQNMGIHAPTCILACAGLRAGYPRGGYACMGGRSSTAPNFISTSTPMGCITPPYSTNAHEPYPSQCINHASNVYSRADSHQQKASAHAGGTCHPARYLSLCGVPSSTDVPGVCTNACIAAASQSTGYAPCTFSMGIRNSWSYLPREGDVDVVCWRLCGGLLLGECG
jgi:hypothetical protein